MSKNILFIVSGLSGAGKDSVIEGLRQEKGVKFRWVVTTTSRPMRPGESEEHPYHFVSAADFEKMIDEGRFIEHAMVYNNHYGVQFRDLEQALESGEPVILKIDYQGVETVKGKFPEATVIFIIPPSMEILEQRLKLRGTDSDEVIRGRLAEANQELAAVEQWSHVIKVVNEEGRLSETIQKVKDIIVRGAQ